MRQKKGDEGSVMRQGKWSGGKGKGRWGGREDRRDRMGRVERKPYFGVP